MLQTKKLSDYKRSFHIDASHYPEIRTVFISVTIMFALMVSLTFLPPILELHGLKDYLPLHNLFETISVIISMLIFAVGYSSKSSSSIVLLSGIFFGVGVLDFSHMLSYAGMPQYVTPSGIDKGIDFWLAARLLSAVGFFLFIISPKGRPTSYLFRFLVLITVIVVTALFHWTFLFQHDLFPHTFFIEGQGLTASKIMTEYVIIGITLLSAFILLIKMRNPKPYLAASLFGALLIMAMSEFLFTLYANETDIYNIFGHIYKVIAYLLVYRAIFVTMIEKPYKELYISQQALREKNKLLDNIIENIPNMIFLKDAKDLRFVLFNKAAEKILGYNRDQILHHNDYDLFPKEEADFFSQKDREVLNSKEFLDIPEESIDTPNGRRYLHTKKITIEDDNGNAKYLLGISEDITEKKLSDEHIRQLAYFDQLTYLPNRAMLNEEVEDLLKSAKKNNQPFSVMFLDLDSFKDINDTLGHSIGDKLLVSVAKRIQKNLEEENVIARLGGDEFIILFPDTDENSAIHIASKLISVVSIPNMIEEHELSITTSIGIALYPNDGNDFETLFKNADTALNKAKKMGGNSFYFFTKEMHLHSVRNLQLSNALRHAIERNELELYYQPQISTKDKVIIGAEALLRWNHPEFGRISPEEFIPITENSGQIIQIGEWVLRSAVKQMQECNKNGLWPMVIAVNLSALQFQQNNLVELVTNIMDESGLPKESLELELTEAITMHEPKNAIRIMNELNEHGIKMSIDDFGTGYSSLSYLRQFKVYKLKIDQSFIRKLANSTEDQAIVYAIINMAKSLGLKTIAEGVETAEQLAFLEEHGCDEIQGYYYSKPLPIEQFSAFIKKSFPYVSK